MAKVRPTDCHGHIPAAGGTGQLDHANAGRRIGGAGDCGQHQPGDGAPDSEKNELKPWLKECWCLPPQGSAEFVCAPVSSTGQAMEDVLEVYHREYQDNEVLVCLDETSKQLVQETRQPLPPRPGAPMAYDHEYQRNGVSNLFMLFAPLEGWRRVEVTDRRTRTDWAEVVRKLVDEDYPNKERIVLVMDNPVSWYGAGSEHPSPGVAIRGLRAGGGTAHRRTAGDSLHAEARELAQYSGDRTGGAGATVP